MTIGATQTAVVGSGNEAEAQPDPFAGWARFDHAPAIDGLRAIAIGLVFLVHTMSFRFPGGFVGVDIFFAISGYLITALLLRDAATRGSIALGPFYRRRFLRLAPALVACVAAVALLALLWPRDGGPSPAVTVPAALLGMMNWLRAFGGDGGNLGHIWSLAIEAQFYLGWAALVAVLAAWRRPRLILAAALIGIVAVNLWRLQLWQSAPIPERLYNGLDTRADALLVGCALAAFAGRRSLGWLARLWFVPAAGLGAIVLMVNWPSAFLGPFGYTVITILAAWLLAASIGARGAVLGVLAAAPMLWLGRRSYSFYLWHFPVLDIVGRAGLPTGLHIAAALAASLVLADVSYRFVELPFLRRIPPQRLLPAMRG